MAGKKTSPLVIKFKRLKKEAVLPVYAHEPGDSCFDLCSAEDYTLRPGEQHLFKIGWASEFPEGYGVFFWPRSGLAFKTEIDRKAGVIDAGYRGEWGVLLRNESSRPWQVKTGDKIAQAVFQKIEHPQIIEIKELSDTRRGEGGFGSTGR